MSMHWKTTGTSTEFTTITGLPEFNTVNGYFHAEFLHLQVGEITQFLNPHFHVFFS